MSHDECISALMSWLVVLTHDGNCPAAIQRKLAWDQAEVERFDNLRRVCGPGLDALNAAEQEHTGEVARILREVEAVYFDGPAAAAVRRP